MEKFAGGRVDVLENAIDDFDTAVSMEHCFFLLTLVTPMPTSLERGSRVK